MDTRLVAILRAPSAARFPQVAEALAAAGVTCVEFTLNSAGCLDALRAARRRLPDTVALGVGTALTPEQVRQAHDAGAQFVVSPNVDVDVIDSAVRLGLPCFPGAFTATEVVAAWRAGATAVKIFPASAVGPSYLSYLRGPLPDVPMLPTGGIGIDDVAAYLRAGAIGVGLGGPLLGDALAGHGDLPGGDLAALAARAERAMAAARVERS
ncbi:MAG: bifunctional 4-hydroxy-2-oxoglutarate aldolase/2-dehydro-3-deoxy-phosphogluconate aldolase [Micromonosporaceae bacterium]|nr:bifunctional 4-hydroxy-2-oxoglutarate aldolase/2-dehydro-3-deoxy-phosphogluconate aldolase [Micromonosporaceae bacterium]